MGLSPSRAEKITAAGCIVSFAVSAALVKFSGFSVPAAVNFQNSLLKKMIIDTAGSGTLGSINALLGYFAGILLALVFLTLAFSFLAAYGFYENRKKAGLVLSLIGGAIFFFFLGFTLASLVVAAGIVAAGYMIIPLAYTYGQEFKKWIRFRVGSNAVGRALFLFNLVVALAVFVAVLAGLQAYQAEFRSDMKESISAIIAPTLPAGIDPRNVDALIDQQISSSPLFAAYARWLPVLSAVGVWFLLEILRLFLPFAAGAFTSALIRLEA